MSRATARREVVFPPYRLDLEAGLLRAGGRAIALAFAWPLAQYLGALSAVRGWTPFRFENGLVKVPGR